MLVTLWKSAKLLILKNHKILFFFTHNLEVPGSSPGWSTKGVQKDIKQHVILAFKTRIIAVKSRFYSDFLFFIHIGLTTKLYLLIVIIRSFSATEIATQKQALKKM